jgi:uncharacterized protein (TIGR00369 family)
MSNSTFAGPSPAQRRLEDLREKEHSQCFVCGPDRGLGIAFSLLNDASVQATFECPETFQGYDGIIHGGVIASLLDAAMTHCLFAHGDVAVTAELCVQYKRPVIAGRPATVSARLAKDYCPLFLMEALMEQDGCLVASATGKFMRREQ